MNEVLFETIEQKNIYCRHSQKNLALIDSLLPTSERKKMRQHITECSVCRSQLSTLQKHIDIVKKYIPKKSISSEMEEDLKIEIGKTIKELEQIYKMREKKGLKAFFKTIRDLERETTRIIFSKSMVKYYMFSIVMGATIKLIS